jgi:hypothetical protein
MPGERYEVRVAGHLDPCWSAWLGDAAVGHDADGTTTLRVTVADQAGLHGLLGRIRDLGVPLLALQALDRPPRDDP